MLKISLLSSFLAFSLLFQACSSEKSNHEKATKSKQNNSDNNTITLHAINNQEYLLTKTDNGFKLDNSQAKILILDVFATWCPPCQAEAPHLASLQKKYKNSIKIIGISIEENIPNDKLQAFRNAHKADYTLVNSPANRDVVSAMAQELKLGQNFGIPLLAIYKNGKLVKYYQGAIEEEFIESDIKKALGI